MTIAEMTNAGSSSYIAKTPPIGAMRYFQTNTITPPTIMPLMAPHLLQRFQNRLNRTTGPKVAPKPEHAVGGQERCGVDDHVLRLGLGAGHCERAGLGHAVADDADDNGDAQGDNDPDGADAAADLELVLVLNGHEVDKDMGHAEVAETPCQSGGNHEGGVLSRFGSKYVGARGEAQVAGDLLCVCDNGIPTAGDIGAVNKNDDERSGHNNALDKARDGGRHETAGRAVGNDDSGGDYHCRHVIKAEEAVEELAAGGKARGGVGHEEHDDDDRADGLNDLGVIAETHGEEVRHGNGMGLCGILSHSLGDDEPVEICTQRQTYCCPAGFGNAAEEGETGNAHQQVRAHIGSLGAHRGDDRAELSAAEVEVLGRGILRIHYAYRQHTQQVDNDGNKDADR